MADTDRPPELSQDWSTVPSPVGSLPFELDPLPPLPPKWSAPLADAPAEGVWKRFEQMKIRCTMTMCDADLHCFRLTRQLAKILSPGCCRECGKALVSLQRTARIGDRIRSRIGGAHHPAEGRQTPIAHDKADALDFSLHAVAACCRKCAKYWHGIPTGRPLEDSEVDYLAKLARAYIRVRLADLPDEPTHVPRRRANEVPHPIPTQERRGDG